MPEAKRVVLRDSRQCSRCRRVMPPGTAAVKDSRPRAVNESRVQEYRKKVWYHADGCPKGGR